MSWIDPFIYELLNKFSFSTKFWYRIGIGDTSLGSYLVSERGNWWNRPPRVQRVDDDETMETFQRVGEHAVKPVSHSLHLPLCVIGARRRVRGWQREEGKCFGWVFFILISLFLRAA